jgi:hypothetical protein
MNARWTLIFVSSLTLHCERLVDAEFDKAHLREPRVQDTPTGGTAGSHDAGGRGGEDTSPAGSSAVAAGGAQADAGAGGKHPDAGGAGGKHPDAGAGGAQVDAGGAGGEQPDAGAGGAGAPTCSTFKPVEGIPTSDLVAFQPAELARSVSALNPGHELSDDAEYACEGVALAVDMLLPVGCDADRDYVAWADDDDPIAIDADWDGPLAHVWPLLSQGPLISPSRPAAFAARAPLPAELVTIITHADDGVARAARMVLAPELLAPPASAPDLEQRLDPLAPLRGRRSGTVFGADGKVLGFCALGECDQPEECISTAALLWNDEFGSVFARQDLFFGNLDSHVGQDAMLLYQSGTGGELEPLVRPSRFSYFADASGWGQGADVGYVRHFVADFDADGLDDLAGVGFTEAHVRLSTGTSFGSSAKWADLSEPNPNPSQLQVGDVDGTMGADLVFVSGGQLLVYRSTGSSFAESEVWATGVPTEFRTFGVHDCTADGKADFILVRSDRVDVYLSDGTKFGEPRTWITPEELNTGEEDYNPGAPGWSFAELTGDGQIDLVLHDVRGAVIFKASPSAAAGVSANRFRFYADRIPLPIGERSNHFADVTGDSDPDAVIVNRESMLVVSRNWNDPAESWLLVPFWGASVAGAD